MDTPPTSEHAVMGDSASEEPVENSSVNPAPGARITIYCNACQLDLGIVENQWIRLTSSYACPHPTGSHHGTFISDRTRIIRVDGGSPAAEGCSMSDIICDQCSTTVGQYCRETLSPEKQHLVGSYFYKLSKITLRDTNLDPSVVEPVLPLFTYRQEMDVDQPGSPVPSVVILDRKWSRPLSAKSKPKATYPADPKMAPPARSIPKPVVGRALNTPWSTSRPQTSVPRVIRRSASVRNLSSSSQTRGESVQSKVAAGTSEGLLALRRVLGQDAVLAKMNIMIENMQREMRELRASSGVQRATTPSVRVDSEPLSARDNELRSLRAENEAMKRILRTLPPQMQFEDPRYSQGYSDDNPVQDSAATAHLGKRKRDMDLANESLLYDENDAAGGYDDFYEPLNETSGLAALEKDTEEHYSIWQSPANQSDGDEPLDYPDDSDYDFSRLETADSAAPSNTSVAGRQGGRSREQRQALPAEFMAEERLYQLSDSNDENFDPNDPKTKGSKYKRTRSAERRRRERAEREHGSLWTQPVPGGGYENGDGWIDQRRHHSGRFGRKAGLKHAPAAYPKGINHKLYASGRQVVTARKRLARELVYLGLEDWIDKDKGDALYRRTIRVARKHYAYHHGGISSKALCQGKYTKKDLEQVGMWDDEIFEEIRPGEESDVENLDFPLDPALRKSIDKWTAEGARAKERQKAAQEAARVDQLLDADHPDGEEVDANEVSEQPLIQNPQETTEFSEDEVVTNRPEVVDRRERHSKFDSIWQTQPPDTGNPVLSIVQHAEARIKAAEDDMGEVTFKTKQAQSFQTIGPTAQKLVESLVASRSQSTPVLQNDGVETSQASVSTGEDALEENVQPTTYSGVRRNTNATSPFTSTCDALEAAWTAPSWCPNRTLKEILSLLDIQGERTIFMRQVRAYFASDSNTGDPLPIEQQVAYTNERLRELSVKFLESRTAVRGDRRSIGSKYWPNNGSKILSYAENRDMITKFVYELFVTQRYHKAYSLQTQLKGRAQDPVAQELLAILKRSREMALQGDASSGLRPKKKYKKDGAPINMNNDSPTRESLVLENSVLQTTTAMKQLTDAFEDSTDSSNDETHLEIGQHAEELLDLGETIYLNPPKDTRTTDEAATTTREESMLDSEAVDLDDQQSVAAIVSIESVTSSPGKFQDTALATTLDVAESDPVSDDEIGSELAAPIQRISEEASFRTPAPSHSPESLTDEPAHFKQPIVPIKSLLSGSPSNKENRAPESELDNDLPSPQKAASIMPRRGRPLTKKSIPRKSTTDLDQLARETMERETRSTAKKSRSGRYFGLRQSL